MRRTGGPTVCNELSERRTESCEGLIGRPVVQSRAAGRLLTSVRECDRESYSPSFPLLSKRKRKIRRVSGSTSLATPGLDATASTSTLPFERIARPQGRRSIDGQAARSELHPAGRWATAPRQAQRGGAQCTLEHAGNAHYRGHAFTLREGRGPRHGGSSRGGRRLSGRPAPTLRLTAQRRRRRTPPGALAEGP